MSTPARPGNGVKSCAGCGGKIVDRFLLECLDRFWHTNCLKCSCCQAPLDEIGSTCFSRGNMILCKNDYIRMFGSSGTCAACQKSIPAGDMVMKTQTSVYHIDCFVCMACSTPLRPGDRYGVFNGQLLCELDYPKVLQRGGPANGPPGLRASHKVC